ncbi:MAG: hypothetical protein HFJ38_05870 [Bacilli bacterium]|nr:hypothetical protein [Bacilli bacterium]
MNNNYDKVDNLFFQYFENNQEIPIVVTKGIERTMRNKKYDYALVALIKKIIITIISFFTVASGIAFAGYTVYEKIWKEPKKYETSNDYLNSLPSEQISEEEKRNLITEDDAKNIALNFLNKLGYEKQTINSIELKRDYSRPMESYYMAKTESSYEKGLMVLIDSKNGYIEYFNDLDLKYKDLDQDIITEEQARQIAVDTYEKIELNKNDYELYSVKKEEYVFENKTKTLWGATFLKKENNIYNKYENFSVAFIVVDNKIIYDTINISTNTEKINNPIIIQEETAIEIAKNKEVEFTNTEITNIKSELSIEKMNTLVYQLEYEIYDTMNLQIEEKIRNVWKVRIEHKNKKDFNTYFNPNQYMKENLNKEFYIDATTGEIIGGKFIENL